MNTPRESVSADVGRCVIDLAAEAASFRSWLRGELPSAEHTLGRRLLELAESSLVSGLFFLFLQQRFPNVFPETRADDGGASHRHVESASEMTSAAIVGEIRQALQHPQLVAPGQSENCELPAGTADVAKCCADALAALVPLIVFAAVKRGDDAGPAIAMGKLSYRFLSVEADVAGREQGAGSREQDKSPLPASRFLLADYEPGALPPLRFRFVQPAAERITEYNDLQVYRFSRAKGVAISPDIAVPVSALFGEDSSLARAAEFLRAEANRLIGNWRQFAKIAAIRKCLPYLENHGVQAVRIEFRARGSDGDVVLLGLPTAAMEACGEFAGGIPFSMALQQAAKESPAREAVLRAVEARWRERGIDPADYSFCRLPDSAAAGQEASAAENERKWRRRVRRFLNQKSRWPLEEADQILKALGIVIESKSDGAPHGRVRFNDCQHTLSSKLLKDGQVYANYLHEWIRTLGQERVLAELIEQNDPRLANYIRKSAANEE